MHDKETFQTSIEKQLSEWRAQIYEHSIRIEDFKAKAEKLDSEAQRRYLEQIQDLESRMDSVKHQINEGQKKLDVLKSGGEEAWEEVKTGAQKAWDDLVLGFNAAWGEIKTSFDQASSKLHDRLPKE